MIQQTVAKLPAAPVQSQAGSLSLSIVDSASVPVPLQPSEAVKLCSLESLVLLRELRSSGPSPKVEYQDVLLGDASFDDVMFSIRNDLGVQWESTIALQLQEDPAQRLASLKTFLIKQMSEHISSPDMQFFGLSPLSSVAKEGAGAPKDDESSMLLVSPSLLAQVQGALALAASRAPAQGTSSASGASSKRASSSRIPKKKKSRADSSVPSSGGVDRSVKEFFPVRQDSSNVDNPPVPSDAGTSGSLNGSSGCSSSVPDIQVGYFPFFCCSYLFDPLLRLLFLSILFLLLFL